MKLFMRSEKENLFFLKSSCINFFFTGYVNFTFKLASETNIL